MAVNRESPEAIEPVKEAKVVSGIELSAAIALLLFGIIPFMLGFWFLRGRPFDLREFALVEVLGIFVFAVIETFAIIVLWGLGRLDLPEKFVHWLGLANGGGNSWTGRCDYQEFVLIRR